jgi:hypothetical protein
VRPLSLPFISAHLGYPWTLIEQVSAPLKDD